MEPMIPQKPLWSEIVQSQDGQIKKPGRSSSKGQQKLLFTNMTLLLSSSGEPEAVSYTHLTLPTSDLV